MSSPFRTWLRRIWVTSGLLFTAWLGWNLQARGVAASAFASDRTVRAEIDLDSIRFVPHELARRHRVNLIFIPGGLVDPDAYVPVVRAVASTGVPSALVKMPWRSALTDAMRLQLWARMLDARTRLGDDRPLVVAGHSRGAAMAARFAAEHPEIVGGLILVGTTHPRDQDLSNARYPILKVMGSRDCVASVAGARANADKLPPHTQWLTIAGANHAQFGYYGSQINDCSAEITRAEQQRQLTDAIRAFVDKNF